MLYSAMFAPVPPKPRPMRESHYLDSAEMLQYMRSVGYTLAEAANQCGITTQQAVNRLRLLELDEGLRAFLRQEAMPENIALLLLRLPRVLNWQMLPRRPGAMLCMLASTSAWKSI